MDELRWVLLAAGGAILLLIYAAGGLTRWRRARMLAHMEAQKKPKAVNMVQETLFQEPSDEGEVGDPLFAEPVRAPAAKAPERSEPVLNISLPEDDADPVIEAPSATSAPASAAPSQASERIMVVNVRARSEQGFGGPGIKRAMDALEMEYGKLHIFHRYPSDPRDERAIFSVANMFEPGWFDLERIEQFVTPGLTFFMQLPGPVEDLTAYDDMLACAEYVSHELGGELLDEQRQPLDLSRRKASREALEAWSRGRVATFAASPRL